MNAFMTEFSSSGFQVLAFPSNEFDMLEPADTGVELMNGIKWVRPGGGYVPKFQMFKTINTNGKDEHELYTFLKGICGPTSDDFEDNLFYDPKRVSDVRWNFEIFLIHRQTGLPLYRYSPDHDLSSIRTDIMKLLHGPIVLSNEIPVETPIVSEPIEIPEPREEIEETNQVEPDYIVHEDVIRID